MPCAAECPPGSEPAGPSPEEPAGRPATTVPEPGGREGKVGLVTAGQSTADRAAQDCAESASCTPAAVISSRAVTTWSSLTGTVRSCSTRTRRPSPSASSAVCFTQCDSAMPTTSTSVTPAEVRIWAKEAPPSSLPSKPEYAASYAPFFTDASGASSASAGCSSASVVPALPCCGQESTKSGVSEKWSPGSMCQSCVV